MKIRTRIIQQLITIVELLTFYPQLKRFYAREFAKSDIRIIDVGANKGQSIDFFKKVFPSCTIVALEPNKSLFKLLQHKYSGQVDITLINKGASNTNGSLTFNENILDETSTFESLNYDSQYLKKKASIIGVAPSELITKRYEVPVNTLSKILSEFDNVQFDILKMDVEGHEYKCLQGLFEDKVITSSVKYIQLEIHEDDMYQDRVSSSEQERLLNTNGFFEINRVKHAFGNFYDVIYRNQSQV